MSFTEIWRCKRCNSLPPILRKGKQFYIQCPDCGRKTGVYAVSLDAVVQGWNRRNDPTKRPGLIASWIFNVTTILEGIRSMVESYAGRAAARRAQLDAITADEPAKAESEEP